MPGVKGETQVMAFDLAGIAVSAGAACSSGKVTPSAVLKAMGADETAAAEAIRVSLGAGNTAEHATRFVAEWKTLYDRTRRLKAAA
jgi:cysteine desulfurase